MRVGEDRFPQPLLTGDHGEPTDGNPVAQEPAESFGQDAARAGQAQATASGTGAVAARLPPETRRAEIAVLRLAELDVIAAFAALVTSREAHATSSGRAVVAGRGFVG